MYPFLMAVIILVSIIALVGTLYVGKNVNQTISKYEAEGYSAEDEVASLQNHGKKTSFRLLTTIYSITFVITAILCAIFIF
ncbi:hypothetical protein [Halobacillus amylolyticus]|uniref:DUF3784 domain-containing protein n=1 Tax=Halobacillus amylolyticus TaxID=2932259 RepID=A0ABY4HFP2_9BACI|nr:hypothetical protein [Halobacillus amylolyticus]UOR13472.1 hypothetical protein MUO15_08470 [Halobacillus amylolyticus]